MAAPRERAMARITALIDGDEPQIERVLDELRAARDAESDESRLLALRRARDEARRLSRGINAIGVAFVHAQGRALIEAMRTGADLADE